MLFARAGKAIVHTLTFLDPNNSNAAVTAKTYSDLQNVVLGYFDSSGTRTTVTASDYLTLTEEDASGDAGEYTLSWTPDGTLGDRWWFLHFTYPTGTQVFDFTANIWVAKTKHTLQTADTVYHSMYLQDPNGTAVTGKTKSDFQAANLNRIASADTTETDEDSSLSITEVGSGYYYASFTPAAGESGGWSMYLTEPTGTLQLDHIETYWIYDGAFASRVQELVMDKVGHAADNYPNVFTNALTDAVYEYSRMHPRWRYYEFAGDGSSYEVNVTSLTGWISQWSKVRWVEYPAKSTSALNDSNYRRPQRLHPTEWQWFDNGNAERITFLTITPASGESAVISYSALHDSDASTVPDGHLHALYKLAASYVLESLANLSIQEQSATLGTDANLDMQTRHSMYLESARMFRGQAEDFFNGLRPPKITRVDVRESPVSGYRRSLTHEPYWD